MLVPHVAYVLRYVWDPIGLGAEGPADGYDSYVPGIITLVRNTTAFEAEIARHLMQIEAEAMGLVPARAGAMRAARALLGLREACGRAPDSLVAQVVGPDGLRCLWVFQRPDGLCTYEHAVLHQDTDENGTYSWWTEAGDGQSGLFPAAEAAEREARATINWLREKVTEEDWRPISPREIAVLDCLLVADFPGRDALAAQARTALVRRIDCEGSLSFQVNGSFAAEVRGRVPVEGRYHDDGTGPGSHAPAVNLLLHVIDGRLHELEIYKDDGSNILIGPFEIPVAQIEVWSH